MYWDTFCQANGELNAMLRTKLACASVAFDKDWCLHSTAKISSSDLKPSTFKRPTGGPTKRDGTESQPTIVDWQSTIVQRMSYISP